MRSSALKRNVVHTCLSRPVRWVNFKFKSRLISPIAFYVIGYNVHRKTIRCETDNGLPAGQAYYDPIKDTIVAREGSFGSSNKAEKSLLIHEVTHAILDGIYRGKTLRGKTSSMNVLDDETIAYLAGAIYLYASKGGTPKGKSNPEYQAYRIVKDVVDRDKTPDGCTTINFSNSDVRPLHAAIRSHKLYKNEWRSNATHNGLSRGLKTSAG